MRQDDASLAVQVRYSYRHHAPRRIHRNSNHSECVQHREGRRFLCFRGRERTGERVSKTRFASSCVAAVAGLAAVWCAGALPAFAADNLAEGQTAGRRSGSGRPGPASDCDPADQLQRRRARSGLVLNRRTDIPISQALSLKEAEGRNDPVFLGGPVEQTSILALLRSKIQPEGAKGIVNDVYLLAGKEVLQKALASKAEASGLHVYVGYAGWGPGPIRCGSGRRSLARPHRKRKHNLRSGPGFAMAAADSQDRGAHRETATERIQPRSRESSDSPSGRRGTALRISSRFRFS